MLCAYDEAAGLADVLLRGLGALPAVLPLAIVLRALESTTASLEGLGWGSCGSGDGGSNDEGFGELHGEIGSFKEVGVVRWCGCVGRMCSIDGVEEQKRECCRPVYICEPELPPSIDAAHITVGLLSRLLLKAR